jgi:hypothetical protein
MTVREMFELNGRVALITGGSRGTLTVVNDLAQPEQALPHTDTVAMNGGSTSI